MPPPPIPVHRKRPKIQKIEVKAETKVEVKEETTSPSSVSGVPFNDDPLSLFSDIDAESSASAAGVLADDVIEARNAAAADSAVRKREDRCEKACSFCHFYTCEKPKSVDHDEHDCGDCNRPDPWIPKPAPPVPPPVRPPDEAPKKIAPWHEGRSPSSAAYRSGTRHPEINAGESVTRVIRLTPRRRRSRSPIRLRSRSPSPEPTLGVPEPIQGAPWRDPSFRRWGQEVKRERSASLQRSSSASGSNQTAFGVATPTSTPTVGTAFAVPVAAPMAARPAPPTEVIRASVPTWGVGYDVPDENGVTAQQAAIESAWCSSRTLPGICWHTFHGVDCLRHLEGKCDQIHDINDESINWTPQLLAFYEKRRSKYHASKR